MHRPFFILIMSLLACQMQAKVQTLTSPNGKIKVDVNVTDRISYQVSAQGEVLLKDCQASLQVGNEWLGRNAKLKGVKRSAIKEQIRNIVPMKNAITPNIANVLTLNFAGNYALEFRAYDNGFAYRFVLNRKGTVDVVDEGMTLKVPEAFTIHLSKTESFVSSYEVRYSHLSTAEWKTEDGMTYLPVLMESPKGTKMLFSEADLRDYPNLFLVSLTGNTIKAVFPKSPEAWEPAGDRSENITKEGNYIARTQGTRTLPWRYMVIGDDATIAANEMGRCLAAPCELSDTSWIRPGKVIWDWWNHWTVWNVDFETGINNQTYKYFIDFAAEYGIEYILLDEGWCKDVRNPIEMIDDIDVRELVEYGQKKGVGVWLWMTWLAVEQHPEVFKHYADMGVKGFKVDFMDHSDQWMVNFYERTAKACADNHLLLDFHGSYKPAGLEYRYPNLINYEGVRGMEYNGGCLPENCIWYPFMRNAVGTMDFTPGSMASLQPKHYVASNALPAGMGTRAYQMALYVAFEGGLQMLADSPTRYMQNDECARYIAAVPATWDETRVLSAKAGQYYAVAKRKGSRWFVAAITGSEPQNLKLDLGFLNKDGQLTLFRDGANAHRIAVDYKKEQRSVSPSTSLNVHLAPNGGWFGVID